MDYRRCKKRENVTHTITPSLLIGNTRIQLRRQKAGPPDTADPRKDPEIKKLIRTRRGSPCRNA